MTGKGGRSRIGFVVLAAAVALAAVGGSAVGLGAPSWLAGAVGAVSALIAGTLVDRVFHARDERAAAAGRLRQVLADLTMTVPGDGDDVLGLLRADRSPVAFRGRRRELRQLADWCADDLACPVVMISGPAGVGKSRLALEFALGLPDGWIAGWLRAGAGQDAVGAVRACGSPAVILVDDADGRPDLAPLLDALAEDYKDPAIRVVVLTRSAVGLRAALASRLDERHESIAASAVELDLQAEGGHDDQERWFAEAASAFAAVLERPVPAVGQRFRAGRAEQAQPMVVLQAQALLAVLGDGTGHADPRDLSFGQLAEALMNHEKRRWRATAALWQWGSGGPLPEPLQERSIAAIALLGCATHSEAVEVLRRIPELNDAPAERLSAIASWISALYPADPGDAPRIRPDMIGEWFVVSQLTAHPELAQSLHTGLTDPQATRALSFLAHAADRLEAAGQLFEDFASGDVRRRILAAAQAATTGQAGRRLLDTVVAQLIRSGEGWTVDQLTELDHLIPEPVLLRAHAAIADLNVTLYRALAADNPAAHQANLARALNNLGIWLDRVGRYPEALAATEEAVTLYRALAADNPAAHQAGLAAALDGLGIWLDRVGRYQDALTATDEALTLYRALAADNPAAHQAGLAAALANLGTRLYRAGRYRDALTATEEAVTLYRALAADNPAAHQAGLAAALDGLGIRLDRVGRYQDALTAAEEAITLRRALAADNPAAHQADLAAALDGLGIRLYRVGRYRDALTAAEEAITLYRALAADNPAAHQAGLAAALTNLGTHLDQVGRYQDALIATEEAITLRRALAADNPAAHQASLATALDNLGIRLDRVGRYQDALAATEEAITLYRALAADNPHQADVARALTNLGTRLYRAGRYQDALTAIEEAITLYRALAADNPAAHQADLATALDNLGILFDQLGEGREALAARIESVHVYRELASRNPDLYQERYRQALSALRREYDQRGMQHEAVVHDLADPPSSS